MNATATLIPEVANRQVNIYVSIRNTSDKISLGVEKRQIFQSELSLGSLVELTCEGKPVPYIGSMAKMTSAMDSEVIRVSPGNTVTGNADITNMFSFLAGKHSYQISYHAFLGGIEEDASLVEVKSEPEIFIFEKQ